MKVEITLYDEDDKPVPRWQLTKEQLKAVIEAEKNIKKKIEGDA
jgi:hypothetical protein